MLVLSTLHNLLEQVLDPPGLHTAVLLTPEGQLVSFASHPARSKDRIRVIVGLSASLWHETKAKGIGMVESEYGRILVLPLENEQHIDADVGQQTAAEPVMLLALNGTVSASWDELREKAQALANHLSKPIGQLHGRLVHLPAPTPSQTRSPRRQVQR
ncbi:hypothetical protein PUNSTDRAFT_56530 [Punctularia strigosozonata HHB-11173 SS5]|uniref:uncharacterized protein n=1 Tax=Punctularia strigosozonata (strain HHB-11173) TaxID=741275 RepID=UPI0004416608|nr:uncharacterized protein PUNSTDRAFT_56530 [Punctularia strigosozonata HHB-11173 SS5]EIN14379.1 hypothetical protein PUNSTDRAFT_56530 [Punctularia strigosozonata HHB-11173 SS5]